MAVTLGRRFLAALLASKDTLEYLRFGSVEHLFRGDETKLWRTVDEHIRRYGRVPTLQTVEENTGEVLPEVGEPPAVYYDRLVERHIELSIKSVVPQVADLLQPGKVDAKGALKKLEEMVFRMYMDTYGNTVTDFRNSYGMVIPEYVKKFKGGDNYGIQMGWPYLDSMAGGVGEGDIVSYVGRPALGKTFQMLYSALHVWRVQKKVPLFVSMEMKPLLIMQRLAAMYSSTPLGQLRTAELSTKKLAGLRDSLMGVQDGGVPFYVVDGSLTSTVHDVFVLASQLKPDVVFIDGAYLLKHPDSRVDRYRRVAENCDMMKSDIATRLGLPVIASWQFSREAVKKKWAVGDKPGLESIGYSDVIGQISSIVLGLFEEESVETIKMRRVEVLKGRSGETGMFCVKWDFQNMDFSEVTEEEESLQFV